ncbi:MAG TPA: PP2C family protein-serine/threonine phosphatase [Candidatus Acidoferrum sp.]|nr:PP2C family protein-serine/threonine phosphatase [Candidatus Acidoferrum sp.]
MTTDTMEIDVSEDWATACDVQERFMQRPADEMDRLEYAALCRQVRALGGDGYDFLPLGEQKLGMAIGDASGKSVAAALMISSVQASLRTAVSFAGEEPAAVLAAVNANVYASSLADRYATLFYGVYDGQTRTMRYANAGHNSPLVIRKDGTVSLLERGGVPVGIFPKWGYEEGLVAFEPGDLIVAYTDGVSEARNEAGEEWGEAGIRMAIKESVEKKPEVIAAQIFGAMEEFSHGRQTDDATVIVALVR